MTIKTNQNLVPAVSANCIYPSDHVLIPNSVDCVNSNDAESQEAYIDVFKPGLRTRSKFIRVQPNLASPSSLI